MSNRVVISAVPQSVIANADLCGNEYAWKPDDFPPALAEAARLGYQCVGGQFQFRFVDGTCEMYWLEASAPDRAHGEEWAKYVARCEASVRSKFDSLMASTNFLREAESWEFIRAKMVRERTDPLQYLFFVAYFEDEHGRCF
jgi:hypothetical protein